MWDPADAFVTSDLDEESYKTWGADYEASILEEAPGVFLMRQGFFHDHCPYLINDWSEMAATTLREDFQAIIAGTKEPEARLKCTDGAYWDITTEKAWAQLSDNFPDGETV